MSKQATKALIDEKITGNGVQAITGPILNNVLNTMVDDYGTQDEVSQLAQKVDVLDAKLFDRVIDQTFTGTYQWGTAFDTIPTGIKVKNTGPISVNMYDVKYGTNHTEIQPGQEKTLVHDVTILRSVNATGTAEISIFGSIDTFEKAISKSSSIVGMNALRKTAASVNAYGVVSISESVRFARKNNHIALKCDFTNFDNDVQIGWGFNGTQYGAFWIVITGTKIIPHYRASTEGTLADILHGLTLSTYLKVCMTTKVDGTINVYLETLGGSFTYTINYNLAVGAPAFRPTLSGGATNVILSASCDDLKCPIWAFGDSYYGLNENSRVFKHLVDLGFSNIMNNSYPGATGSAALDDFVRAINLGYCPKYVVWSLGMNGGGLSVYQTSYQTLKDYCDNLGITLILQTIPVPANTIYIEKQEITDYIKATGLRYIDAYGAVGSNSNGEWYGNGTDKNYQSSDNVHPSSYGATAIASQWLVDFPEVMQYGVDKESLS